MLELNPTEIPTRPDSPGKCFRSTSIQIASHLLLDTHLRHSSTKLSNQKIVHSTSRKQTKKGVSGMAFSVWVFPSDSHTTFHTVRILSQNFTCSSKQGFYSNFQFWFQYHNVLPPMEFCFHHFSRIQSLFMFSRTAALGALQQLYTEPCHVFSCPLQIGWTYIIPLLIVGASSPTQQ